MIGAVFAALVLAGPAGASGGGTVTMVAPYHATAFHSHALANSTLPHCGPTTATAGRWNATSGLLRGGTVHSQQTLNATCNGASVDASVANTLFLPLQLPNSRGNHTYHIDAVGTLTVSYSWAETHIPCPWVHYPNGTRQRNCSVATSVAFSLTATAVEVTSLGRQLISGANGSVQQTNSTVWSVDDRCFPTCTNSSSSVGVRTSHALLTLNFSLAWFVQVNASARNALVFELDGQTEVSVGGLGAWTASARADLNLSNAGAGLRLTSVTIA